MGNRREAETEITAQSLACFHSPRLVALLQSSSFSFLNLHLDLGRAGGWAEWTSILIVDGFYRVPLRRQVRINWKLG